MRVTQLMTFNNLTKELSKNREALAKYQQQLSTGKQVTKASDGSIPFTISRRLNNEIQQNKQYQTNITSGLSKATTAEDTLNGIIDTLTSVKTVAVSGASDTKSAQDRTDLANQVSAFKKKISNLANTEFNGTYLFGGTNSSKPPFKLDSSATGGVSDTSNNKPLKIQISNTSSVNISVAGKDLRNTKSGDLFNILQKVSTALRNNNPTKVHSMLGAIDNAISHVTSLTASLGNNINRMNYKTQQLQGQEITQKGQVSQLVDTNYAKTMTNIQKYEVSYQAALSAHARIIKTSLLNYL